MKKEKAGKKWIANFCLQLAELFINVSEDKTLNIESQKFGLMSAEVLVQLAKRELK